MEEIDELARQMDLVKIESYQPEPLVILYDNETLKHSSAKQHPQNPQRLQKILENLKAKNLLDSTKVKVISQLKPVEKELVLETHGENYTEFVLGMWPEDDKRKQIYISVDTYFNKHTTECALLAAGGVIQAVDEVLEKKHLAAYAIVRPPGHHAGLKQIPHGFCFLNNAGLGAKYALSKYKKKRVLILDWDAHHGEGTQNLFYQSKNVLYASLHRFDHATFFPNLVQSSPEFIGKDEGSGYNINIGWNVHKQPFESCGNSEYVYAFQRLLLPVFRQFNPELVIISCGFDSGCDDPIGGLEVTAAGYQYMTKVVKDLGAPVVVVLEGGYNFDTLQWGSESVVRTLLGTQDSHEVKKLKEEYVPNRVGVSAVDQTLKHISSYWKSVNQKQLIQLQNTKLKLLLKSIPYANKQKSQEEQDEKHQINVKKNKKDDKSREKEKKESSNIQSSLKSEDTRSVATGASTGPMTRAKTKQIEKDQQL